MLTWSRQSHVGIIPKAAPSVKYGKAFLLFYGYKMKKYFGTSPFGQQKRRRDEPDAFDV